MVITKKTTFITIWIVMLIGTIYTLMHISHQVKNLESSLKSINANIKQEKQNIRTLSAEWSYLTDPSRIEKLSAELLPNLTIIKASDISKLDNIKEFNNVISITDETDKPENIIRVFIGNTE